MWKYHIDSGICQLNLNNSRIFAENTKKTPCTLGLGNHTAQLTRCNQGYDTSWVLYLFPI